MSVETLQGGAGNNFDRAGMVAVQLAGEAVHGRSPDIEILQLGRGALTLEAMPHVFKFDTSDFLIVEN